jgi:hypothetical protein
MFGTLFKTTIIVFLLTTTVEYTLENSDAWYKPSSLLTEVAGKFNTLFTTLGTWFAKLCSFLTYIKLGKFIDAGYRILQPLIDISFSWANFFDGYFAQAKFYVDYYKIYIGTVVLVGLVLYLAYRFDWFNKFYYTRLGQWFFVGLPMKWYNRKTWPAVLDYLDLNGTPTQLSNIGEATRNKHVDVSHYTQSKTRQSE